MLECDKCQGKVQEESKFCPHCGDPVTEADKVVHGISVSRVAEVEISFGVSSSSSFDKALQMCKNTASYVESGEGKSIQYVVKLPITEIELLINIWELVGSWKSTKMLINGQPATKSSLVYKGVGCFRNRLKSYDRMQYCCGEKDYEFNIWSCKKLDMPLYTWGGGWLDFGFIDKAGVWHFDKDRIRHGLQSMIHENELCPALDVQRVMETLDNLPDTINPKTNHSWTYTTDYEDINGDFREVAIGIKPVIHRASQYVIGDFKPNWKILNEDTGTERVSVTTTSTNKSLPRTSSHKSGCSMMIVMSLVGIIVTLLATRII